MPMKPPTPQSRISALSTSHHTCIHMVLHQLGFCGIPMLAPESRFGETRTLVEKVKLPVCPFDRRRKGTTGQLLLGCVRVGHIYEHGKPKIFMRFPPIHPKGVFRAQRSR